jgi:AcrR family transcriptional regulator
MLKTARLAAPAGAPNRKVDLVRTAYRLFSEKGVHRVPLDEIASAAGLSKGLVIYYFKTKENLVLETMRWALDTTAERVRQAMAKATTPHGKVLAMIEGIWSGPTAAFTFSISISPAMRPGSSTSRSSAPRSIRSSTRSTPR